MGTRTLLMIGLAVATIGGLFIAAGAWTVIQSERRGRAEMARRREKAAYLLGGIFLALGLGIQLVVVVIRG